LEPSTVPSALDEGQLGGVNAPCLRGTA